MKSSTEARLFLVVIALELAITGLMIGEGRYPPTHDGQQHFLLQWFFENGVATTGEPPRWMPWLTGGNIATWWWAVQANAFSAASSLLGTWLPDGGFLALWHLGVLCDELVLLVGVWLLARRLVRSPYAVFLIAVAALGSTSWALQPWYSLRLVHAVPLLIELGHRFLESGRWRHVAAGATLLVVQSFGSLPYFFPVITFTVFVWFAAHLAVSPEARQRIRSIRFGVPAVFACAVLAGILAVAWLGLNAGTDELVQFSHRREAGGAVTLDWFLSYGGNARMRKWLELVTRVTPALDYTVYVGMFVLPFAIIGVLSGIRRSNAHVFVALLVLLELSVAHPLSAIVYWVWPLMRYYRHLTLLGVLPKLFLCFVAGIGVDRLIDAAPAPRQARLGPIRLRSIPIPAAAAASAVLLLTGAAWTWTTASSPDAPRRLASLVTTLPTFSSALNPATLPARLHLAGLLAVMAAIVGAAFAFPSRRRAVVLMGVALATADLYAWKIEHLRLSTTKLGEARERLLAFTPLPWIPARCPLAPCGDPARRTIVDPGAIPGGTLLNQVVETFLFEDELGSSHRVDNWLEPYDTFVRAANGAPDPFDRTRPPPGFRASAGLRVRPSEAVMAIAGVSEGKLQVHTRAYAAGERRIAELLQNGEWQGDILLVAAGSAGAIAVPDELPAGTTRRDDARATVSTFSANRLAVDVDAGGESAWLYVAETWHPGWQATVDGQPAPVARANLAYRAVPLPPGAHRVELTFRLPGLLLAQRVLAVAGAAVLAWTLFTAWKIATRTP